MKQAVNILGTLITTMMIMSIPILCTCSYLLNWEAYIKFISTMLTVLEMIVMGATIYAEVE